MPRGQKTGRARRNVQDLQPQTESTAARLARLQAERAKFLQQQAQSQRQRKDTTQVRQNAGALAAQRRAKQRAGQTRRVTHTVKQTDSIESIADKYGLSPQDALQQAGVERLRAGQVLKFDATDIRAEKEVSGAQYGLAGLERSRVAGGRADRLAAFRAKQQQELFGSPFGLGAGLGGLAPQETPRDIPSADAIVGQLDVESELASGGGFVDTQRELDKQNLGRVQEKWKAIKKDEDFAAGQANLSRLIYGRLGEALNEGDLSKRVDYITPYVWSLFPVELQKIYREQLGYYQRADGVWVPADFPEEELGVSEEDWGEGAGGGLGGGGGGGGGYTEKTRTKGGSSYRGGARGVRTRVDRRQLTVGGTARTGWRI